MQEINSWIKELIPDQSIITVVRRAQSLARELRFDFSQARFLLGDDAVIWENGRTYSGGEALSRRKELYLFDAEMKLTDLVECHAQILKHHEAGRHEKPEIPAELKNDFDKCSQECLVQKKKILENAPATRFFWRGAGLA